MLRIDLEAALAQARGVFEQTLHQHLAAEVGIPGRLFQAMSHSLLAGGKRLRPILLLWTYEAFAASDRATAPVTADGAMLAACGIECLHTYSLIHDDLPAMDDDQLRRGRPTCHVAFDEATAILAGDGLQALGFRWLGQAGQTRAAALVEVLATAVGPAGMVGGQQLDLDSEGQEVDAMAVDKIHRLKTGALLAACLVAGGILAGVPAPGLSRLEKAGLDLGLAFQGADDLLDLHGDIEAIGKTPGKDLSSGKATWIRLEGETAARERIQAHGQAGIEVLDAALPDNEFGAKLLALGQFMWQREV